MKKIFCLLIAVCLAATAFAQKEGKGGGMKGSRAAGKTAAAKSVRADAGKTAIQQNKVPQANVPLASANESNLPPADPALEKDLLDASGQPAQPQTDSFVAQRETVPEPEAKQAAKPEEPKVVYNPKRQVDPTLSPDDILLIEYREQQRLAAEEAERQRKLAEERRAQEEAERQRQLELARLKDPTREVRNKIKIGGIIGQEVFIGSKIYTVGNSIFGARIVEVRSDTEEVVFTYKGHKFVRKVQLSK